MLKTLFLRYTLAGLLALLFFDGFGQVDIVNEPFTSAPLPAGWSQSNIIITSYARFTATNSVLTSPILDLTGYTGVTLEFQVAKYGTGTNGPITVEFSDDGGNSWTAQTFNSPTPTSSTYLNSGPTSINVTGPNVQFRFTRLASSSDKRLRNVVLKGFMPSTTLVQFSSATYTETESTTSVDLCMDITNEDAVNTELDVVLVSSLGTYLTSPISQHIIFDGSSTTECTTITWTNNATCDGNETYTFEIQNVTGGNAAAAGSQNSTDLTITDDELSSGDFYVQDFDGTPTVWTYSGAGSNSLTYGNTGQGRRIGGNSFFEFNQIATTGINEMVLRMKTASVGGIENADKLKIFVNLNEVGYSLNPDITIQEGNISDGSFNKSWNYSASGVASTTAGVPLTFYGDGATGYSTVEVVIPNGTTSISVKVESENSAFDEYYYIDDIKLTGEYCNTACIEPTTQASFDLNTPTFLSETGATLDWTNGNGNNHLVILKENSAISSNPVDGESYNANSAFSVGADIGTGEYAVYNGSAETVALTNLSPGTEYFAKIFGYNCLPGNEDYLTSGTPDTDVFITPPENPASFDEGCVGATSINLSWTAPADGNFDGYMLVAREGASPHAVTTLDPSSQPFNLDYGSAPTYGGSVPLSRVLYRGTGLSVNVTNLSPGVDYTFEVLAYTIGSSGYRYSAGTTTSQTIVLEDVTSLTATPSATSIELSWAVNATCVDEIIVVAFIGGIASNPSGIGYTVSSNQYTDAGNPTLAGGEKVVFSSASGTSATITQLTTEIEYCFKVFVRKGSEWSSGNEICETPRSVTVLLPGDISVVAVNTDTNTGDSQICFFSYKSITTGTTIDITDNGYERVSAGLWGDTEGVIRIERSGNLIPAGTTISIEGEGNGAPGNFTVRTCGIDDGGWIISSQNGNFQLNLNSSDQIWILQGGNWINPGGRS